MNRAYYTGIGSRSLDPALQETIEKISLFLYKKGFILRSGGADGSDTAFEKPLVPFMKEKQVAEIILPWNNFSGRWHDCKNYFTFGNFDKKLQIKATKIAETIHPAWSMCSDGAKTLHSRNIFQLMGLDLKTPSKFVVAWTEGAEEKGGTRTCLVLAKQKKIPIYNIADSKQLDKLREFCKTL